MILCQVVSVNRLGSCVSLFGDGKFAVATALCRRVGWLEAPRQSGATTAIEWFYAYFALASAFFSAVALASASLYEARSIA